MTEQEKLNRALQEQQKLKDLSAYSLPDNPSQKGWSSGQIKAKMYKGEFYLYSLLSALRSNLEDNYLTNEETIAEINNLISQGYATIEYVDSLPRVYFNDNLPTDTSQLKTGDFYFEETN